MIKLKRARIGTCPGLDITVKGARGRARILAPEWEWVMGLKAGTMSQMEYTQLYTELVLGTLTIDDIKWLTADTNLTFPKSNLTLTFLCYCRDNDFCHTHLVIDYLVARWPHLFTK